MKKKKFERERNNLVWENYVQNEIENCKFIVRGEIRKAKK